MKSKISHEKRMRLQMILLGITMPVLVAITMYLLRPEPIQWLFFDTKELATTNGMIIFSGIEISGSPAFNAVGWHYVIQYEYSVGGSMYNSNIVNYGYTGSSDKSFAEEYVSKYPAGKSVLVYYEPMYPEKSVLEPFVKDYQAIYIIGGSLLFGVFIIALSFYIK